MDAIGGFVLLLIVSCCFAAPQDDWHAYKTKHGKSYNEAEDATRLAHYQRAAKLIAETNAKFDKGEVSGRLAFNHLSDRSEEELQHLLGFRHHPQIASAENLLSVEKQPVIDTMTLPASIDWTTLGAVTPVKDQQQCGSCYTFSATGAMEGQYFRKYNTLLSFSEQQIVDCGTAYSSSYLLGCGGGNVNVAFNYVKAAGGIDSESTYPYTSYNKTGPACLFKSTVAAKVTGYTQVATDETSMMTAVANIGPISVSIAVNGNQTTSTFYHYNTGMINPSTACLPAGSPNNHAVLIVGYGTLNGVPYWKVKNSWNTWWGISGYFLVQRGINACGINLTPSYPIMA